MMPNKYPISSYNKYICLKIDGTMWLILLFILKPYFITLFSVANMGDRMQLITMFYPDKLVLSLGAFAGIPTALLIYAWVKRMPGASNYIRRIWKNGRSLLAISAILNACIILGPQLLGTVYKITVSGWVQLLINILIVIVVYKSPYIKDCFSDFPEN